MRRSTTLLKQSFESLLRIPMIVNEEEMFILSEENEKGQLALLYCITTVRSLLDVFYPPIMESPA